MNWKDTIRTFAPTVAAALGGPMAGVATKMISSALLGQPEGSQKEIMNAVLGASPDDLLKLRTLETDFEAEMARLEVDVFKLEVEDRKDARQAHAESKAPMVIGVFSFIGFFGILIAMIFVKIPESSAAPLNVMLGILGTLVIMIAKYYYGSSKGSSDKNAIISGLK